MKWRLKSKAPEDFIKRFPEYSSLIIQLLYDRGIETQQQIDEFFNCNYKTDIHDPFLLKDMDIAVGSVLKAIKNNERIVIFGDYDADGVCSSAILYLTLKKIGADNINVYIPDRGKEGHGLNQMAVEKIINEGAKLIITVDCGSRDIEMVDLINSLGAEIIITDHHEVGDKLPKAIAMINFHRKDDKYPFKNLAGAGVAYKLACALLSSELAKNRKVENLKKWLLDLTAIATVADVMPIIGENRTLLIYGLGVLAQTKWIGLQELMNVSKLQPKISKQSVNGEAPITNLDSFTIGFVLGPRLNSAGRMDHANVAFNLLTTEDRNEAIELAQQLTDKNIERQKMTDKIVMEVVKRLEKDFDKPDKPKIIFEGSPDWSVGLVGLVAGKIANKYCRPTFIYQDKGNAIHVSGRSIPQFNLIESINECADLCVQYGGHRGAAGFVAKQDKIDEIKERINNFADPQINENESISIIDIDSELFFDDVGWSSYNQLQRFAPFGNANTEPKFLIKNVEVVNARTVGSDDKHLKMDIKLWNNDRKLAKNLKAIGFGLGEWANNLQTGNIVNLVFEFTVNEWNNYRDLELRIIDLKVAT
ncbi:MAG: single-stranded-DNA-specific exonuclease RecJ [bacterium]